RRRHTRSYGDWSSDVCSSDLGRQAERTENAVYGALMAAFMGVSPFVANAAGRWADANLSRAAQAQQASLRQVPATLLQAAPAHKIGRASCRERGSTARGSFT